MREFGFELRLCAHLEATTDQLIARQLGGGVTAAGNRILDVVCIEPGPDFAERTAITPETIPAAALQADVGVGTATYRKDAFGDIDMPPDRIQDVIDRAVEIGFFERERDQGRTLLRQTARYPPDWFDRIIAIENKPDLDNPGDLHQQLRLDVSLGLVDAVVVATGSYVTNAHLHRFPDPVGVWRLTPDELTVVRDPQPLPVPESGIEILDQYSARSDIRIVGSTAKRQRRRRLAEIAYGKGWRTFEFPGCRQASAAAIGEIGGLPCCDYFDRLVNPATECSSECPGFEAGPPPSIDLDAERARSSPWVREAAGTARRQSDLETFR